MNFTDWESQSLNKIALSLGARRTGILLILPPNAIHSHLVGPGGSTLRLMQQESHSQKDIELSLPVHLPVRRRKHHALLHSVFH